MQLLEVTQLNGPVGVPPVIGFPGNTPRGDSSMVRLWAAHWKFVLLWPQAHRTVLGINSSWSEALGVWAPGVFWKELPDLLPLCYGLVLWLV